ncbi:hypothetical protein ACWDT6_28075 [Nocardia grenadensis]
MIEDGASVDSVTGELTTRLGAVGGSAGEVMRRGVRDAAGGAQTIALLMEADAAAAQHVGPADIAAAAAPGSTELTPSAERPLPAAEPTETRTADHYPGSADRLAAGVSPDSTASAAIGGGVGGDRPPPDPAPHAPDPAPHAPDPAPHAPAEAHPAPGTPATPEPPEPTPGPQVAGPPPAAGQQSAVPVPTADDPPRTDAAVPPGDPIAAAAGHTPWTPTGAEQASGHPPGSTPWNSGTGSSMPYLPGMPGGLGSLTPQERPPRGSAPWSRGRGSQEGTVFPRPRPDRPNSTNRTEWAPP